MATLQRTKGKPKNGRGRVAPTSTSTREILAARLEAWKAHARTQPGGGETRQTYSGVPVEGVYTPLEVDGLDPLADIGLPGEFPFTPACTPPATAAGCGRCASSPGSARRRRPTRASSTCSKPGQTGLSVAFDLPTLMGYDADHPLRAGEVGKCGVASPRWPTWRCCSTASRSATSRRR